MQNLIYVVWEESKLLLFFIININNKCMLYYKQENKNKVEIQTKKSPLYFGFKCSSGNY